MYSFDSRLIKEGKRTFVKIPFNVWDVCNKKGVISVEVISDATIFECKLIPKGKGIYYIPISKKVFKSFNYEIIYTIQFKIIDQLTRITGASPYSIENPIRVIDKITHIKQPDSGLCGQTCLAMLAGVSVEEVILIMKSKKYEASFSKLIESLDYFGFTHKKPVYKIIDLPECCLLNVKGDQYNHFMVLYKEKFYDPSTGVLNDYKINEIICYVEIDIK